MVGIVAVAAVAALSASQVLGAPSSRKLLQSDAELEAIWDLEALASEWVPPVPEGVAPAPAPSAVDLEEASLELPSGELQIADTADVPAPVLDLIDGLDELVSQYNDLAGSLARTAAAAVDAAGESSSPARASVHAPRADGDGLSGAGAVPSGAFAGTFNGMTDSLAAIRNTFNPGAVAQGDSDATPSPVAYATIEIVPIDPSFGPSAGRTGLFAGLGGGEAQADSSPSGFFSGLPGLSVFGSGGDAGQGTGSFFGFGSRR